MRPPCVNQGVQVTTPRCVCLSQLISTYRKRGRDENEFKTGRSFFAQFDVLKRSQQKNHSELTFIFHHPESKKQMRGITFLESILCFPHPEAYTTLPVSVFLQFTACDSIVFFSAKPPCSTCTRQASPTMYFLIVCVIKEFHRG